MGTIKLILNKSKQHTDGKYPLVFQLIQQRRKKLLYTTYSIEEESFDSQKQEVILSDQSDLKPADIQQINQATKHIRKRLKAISTELETKDSNYTVEDWVALYKLPEEKNDLFLFIDNMISRKREEGREGIARAYYSTKTSLWRFTNGRRIDFKNISSQLIHKYEAYLIEKGNNNNTIRFYIRNLRTLYNLARAEGYKMNKTYPFTGIRTSPSPTVKRALEKADLARLDQLDLSQHPDMELARDLFMFSFYTRGMSFVDVVHLKKENISNEIIHYVRKKTNQPLHISLTPQLQSLIQKYKNETEYIFPILQIKNEKLYHQYRLALGRINRNLRKIQKDLALNIPLTTYVARHSWATMAKKQGAPISIISESLGHTSEKTTRIYLKQFDQSSIDQINLLVSNFK